MSFLEYLLKSIKRDAGRIALGVVALVLIRSDTLTNSDLTNILIPLGTIIFGMLIVKE